MDGKILEGLGLRVNRNQKRLNYLRSLKLHTRETAAVNKPYALPSIHRAAVEGKIVRQNMQRIVWLT